MWNFGKQTEHVQYIRASADLAHERLDSREKTRSCTYTRNVRASELDLSLLMDFVERFGKKGCSRECYFEGNTTVFHGRIGTWLDIRATWNYEDVFLEINPHYSETASGGKLNRC